MSNKIESKSEPKSKLDAKLNSKVNAKKNDAPIKIAPGKNPDLDLHSNEGGSLQALEKAKNIVIKEQIDPMKAMKGIESNNQYTILDDKANPIFYAYEESTYCVKNCCGGSRPFTMNVFDTNNKKVFRMKRPYRMNLYCCMCCPNLLQQIEVFDKEDKLLGSVHQTYTLKKIFNSGVFKVYNPADQPVYRIVSPLLMLGFTSVDFNILGLNDDTKYGVITNQWTNLTQVMCTDADTYKITFPADADVNMKATFIGATFLIEYMFYVGESRIPATDVELIAANIIN